MPTRRMKTVALTDVIARALTDPAFLRDLQAGPSKVRQTLARRKLALTGRDLKALAAIIPLRTKVPPPPPPPPSRPTFLVAGAVLTTLNARIDKVERMTKLAVRRSGRGGA
jgi:hypothetical protein